MPAISTLTVNDGAATPVSHTFAFAGQSGSRFTFADKASGIPIGYTKITHEVRDAKSATGANSVIIGLELPTVSSVSGVNTRVRVSSAQVRLNFAQDSTDQERKDAVAYVINYLSNATIRPALYNTEPFYG